MPKPRKQSPARSQGGVATPRRQKSRGSRSLCSPALSNASGRLTSVIDHFKDKNMESFALSPLNGRSVLNDNTDIEEPRRKSWWKKLDENSQEIMEVLEENKVTDANNIIEELIDIEVLSQEKKNYTLDLPESSDNESINSIVLPQRRLFTQKENQPQKKFNQLFGNTQTLAKLHKTNTTNIDKTINVGTRELFQNTKRSKPVFPAALINMSPNKTTADKTKENIVPEPKTQVRSIFGNRPANKRKNIFVDFIVSESEDEIPDIQPKVFGFQKKPEQRRFSTVSKGKDASPTSSITTDMELDDWKLLPSSTMVENQLEDMVAGHTPVKRARLSKLSEAKESEAGTNTIQTNTTIDKTKQSNKSVSSKNKSKSSPDFKEKTLNNSRITRSITENIKNQNTTVLRKDSQEIETNKSKINKSLQKPAKTVESVESQPNEQLSADDNVDGNLVLGLEIDKKLNSEGENNVSQEITEEENEIHETEGHESEEIENKVNENEDDEEANENEVNIIQGNGEIQNESCEKDAKTNSTNQSQEVENEGNESEENEDNANGSEENEDEANESNENEDEVNESEENEDEGIQSQENEDEGNESQEVYIKVNESQEIEAEANESQEVEDDDVPDDKSEEINEGANESHIHTDEVNESQEIHDDANESQSVENISQENDAEATHEAESEPDDNESIASEGVNNDQQTNDSVEADKAIASDTEMSEQDDNQDEMEVDDDENEESDNDGNVHNEDESQENQNEEQKEMEPSAEEIEGSPNVTHDTTGRNRKKEASPKSPEVIRHDKTNLMDSFMAHGRNTSVRKSKSMIKNLNIKPSLAPHRNSTAFSDGTTNSSAEGSGWDSHRTTRKTLRQTFGKDFTPRKSLRALVMEKSAKRQTEQTMDIHLTVNIPQANSTEFPEDSNRDVDVPESDHEISRNTRQTTLEMYLQKMKQQNIEKKLKMEEAVRNSLKAPARDTLSLFKVPNKPAPHRPKPAQSKPRKQFTSVIPMDQLPAEVIEDMKYKPPKRFRPTNASWVTKRLYKYLENKLEPKYDYKARIRAEQLVETIYHFAKDLRRHVVAPAHAVEVLKHELARLDVVNTHFEFYEFFHEFLPREVRIKVVPDIVNKIPLPRHGVFSEILRGNTI